MSAVWYIPFDAEPRIRPAPCGLLQLDHWLTVPFLRFAETCQEIERNKYICFT